MTETSRKAIHSIHDALGVGVPTTVTGLTVLGIGLQDWVYIFTLIIATMQIIRYTCAAWNWWHKRKAAKRPPATVPAPR